MSTAKRASTGSGIAGKTAKKSKGPPVLTGHKKKMAEIRRENMKVAVSDAGGAGKVAALMGYAGPSPLSQLIGPTPSRNVSEDVARKMEVVLGLPSGQLDREPGSAIAETPSAPSAIGASHASAPQVSTDLVAAIIRLVGQVCDGEKVQLPTSKFADLVILACTDSVAHGGQIRPDHVKALVRLLK